MNPNIQRHVFANCSRYTQRALPDHALFIAERGERCVPLTTCWTELLSDCTDLGPVALVSQNAGAQLARCVEKVEFAPVPMGTEIVELASGFVVDTAEWSHGLAVEEPAPGGSLFSLQFFAHDGTGLWKLLLTRDAELDHFAGLVRHYASGAPPPISPRVTTSTANRLAKPHSTGAHAQEVSHETFLRNLLEARRDERRLPVTVGRGGLSFSASLVPRRLEWCACAVHAYDYDAEFHLAIGEKYHFRRMCERNRSFLEALDSGGALIARLGQEA